MKILAVIISAIATVWLESFFMAGLGAPDTIYFSLILMILLLLPAQKPRLALIAALASGAAADLAAVQTPFGFLLATQALAYALARKTVNGAWTAPAAARALPAVIIIAVYALWRQIMPWFFLLSMPGSEVKPPLPLRSALAAALYTGLFFLGAAYSTGVVRRLAKKWFL